MMLFLFFAQGDPRDWWDYDGAKVWLSVLAWIEPRPWGTSERKDNMRGNEEMERKDLSVTY